MISDDGIGVQEPDRVAVPHLSDGVGQCRGDVSVEKGTHFAFGNGELLGVFIDGHEDCVAPSCSLGRLVTLVC